MVITWPVAITLVHRGIQIEERELAAKFGAAVRDETSSLVKMLLR
jgi:protein-S-isoprenylcysteine O-methyltransferase Ste14